MKINGEKRLQDIYVKTFFLTSSFVCTEKQSHGFWTTRCWIIKNYFLRGGCDAFKCSLYAYKCSSRFCPQQKNNNLKESEWGQNRHATRGAAREETNRRIVMAGARPRGRADKKKEKGLWIETFFPLEEISFIRSRT